MWADLWWPPTTETAYMMIIPDPGESPWSGHDQQVNQGNQGPKKNLDTSNQRTWLSWVVGSNICLYMFFIFISVQVFGNMIQFLTNLKPPTSEESTSKSASFLDLQKLPHLQGVFAHVPKDVHSQTETRLTHCILELKSSPCYKFFTRQQKKWAPYFFNPRTLFF